MSLINELKYFGNSLSLLIVEDDEELNQELVEILSPFFDSIEFALDGQEGLDKYKTFKPDIVLTDITMPNMNGIKMSQEIKNIYRKQSILVLSAHSDTKFMIELIDIGINQFILKPLDGNNLMYKLLKVAENIFYKKEFDKFYKEEKKKRIETIQKENQISKKNTVENNTLENRTSKIKEVVVEKESIDIDSLSEHTKKDSSDFMEDIQKDDLIWQTFKDDITELMQLSSDFGEDIDNITLSGLTGEIRDRIVQIIREYILIFSTLDQMSRMNDVLSQLAEFLEELDIDSLSEEQQKKLKILEFIHNDIGRFLQTIFVYQDTIDIYYLEDSLESSIVQMKNNVLGTQIEEEELELF